MSSSSPITFHTYPGLGEENSKNYHYSQAVRIGPIIKSAGQGGFTEAGKIVKPLKEQVRATFENVERALRSAGGKGWSQVYSVHTYHIDLDDSFETVVEMFKESMPDHRPVWVAVGVAKLGEGVFVEMEVEAYDGLLN